MLEFSRLDEAIDFIRSREKPLALYLFTSDKAAERRVLDTCSFGGGCINDTIIHLATTHMPLRRRRQQRHGQLSRQKRASDTFTHARSIVKKSTWLDLPMRYHPYSEKKLGLVKNFYEITHAPKALPLNKRRPFCAAQKGKNFFQNPIDKWRVDGYTITVMIIIININSAKEISPCPLPRKHSRKRDAILECLRCTTSHPTAEWVYTQLKAHHP